MSAADRVQASQSATPSNDPASAPAAAPSENVSASGAERTEMSSRYNRMRDHFAKQKKVRVRVQEDTFVQVNGYTFTIKGKEPVMVPEQIADMLMESGLI